VLEVPGVARQASGPALHQDTSAQNVRQ
jgi:hypothetical protein